MHNQTQTIMYSNIDRNTTMQNKIPNTTFTHIITMQADVKTQLLVICSSGKKKNTESIFSEKK